MAKQAKHVLNIELIADSLSDAIITINTNNEIVMIANHAIELIFGYSKEELIGQDLCILMPDRFREKHRAGLKRYLKSGQKHVDWKSMPLIGLHRDGHEFAIEISFNEYKENQQHFFIGVIRDVSDRNRSRNERDIMSTISNNVLQSENLEDFLSKVHLEIKRIMPAENFYIALYNEKEDTVSFPYFVDQFDESPKSRKFGNGLTEYVLKEKIPLLLTREHSSNLIKTKKLNAIGSAPSSWLGVPLIRHNETIGALVVQSYQQNLAYTERDKDTLVAIANHVAIALDRKIQNEALVISEKKYKNLIYSISDIIYSISIPEGRLSLLNPIFERITGWKTSDWIGKSFTNLIHPNDLTSAIAIKDQLAKGKILAPYELRLIKKDGSYMIGEFTSVPEIQNGKVIAVSGIVRDITDRKKSIMVIKESEERFRTLFNESNVSITIHDAHSGAVVDANLAAIKSYGLDSLDELKKNEFWMEAPYSEVEAAAIVEKAFNEGPQRFEWCNRHKNGDIFWEDVRLSIIKINGVEHVLASAVDITERKKAEAERQFAEMSYKDLFNTVEDAIYIQKPDGSFIDVNDSVLKMYGYPREFFIGNNPAPLSAPNMNDIQAVGLAIQKTLEGNPQSFEFWGLRKNGEIFPKEVRLKRGKYLGEDVIIAMARDITDRKRIEKETELNQAITLAVSQADDINDALMLVMQLLCKHSDWPVAEAWIPDPDRQVLVYSAGYAVSDQNYQNFQISSQSLQLEIDQGLPGKVWRTKTSIWDKDIISDKEFVRRKEAKKAGLHSALAIPVIAKGTVEAVMVFFMNIEKAENITQIRFVDSIARQLGSLILRKRVELNVRENEERFRTVSEQTGQVIYDCDIKSGKIRWAGAMKEITGYSSEDYQRFDFGKWKEFIHPEDKDMVIDYLYDAMYSKNDFELEFRLLVKGDFYIIVEIRGAYLYDEAGTALRLIGTMNDITWRKEAEKALAKSEHQLQLIVQSVEEGIHGLDHMGHIVFENQSSLKAFGWEAHKMIGQHAHSLMHHHRADGSEFPSEECPIYQTLQDGESRFIEEDTFFRMDGSSFPVEYSCSAIKDDHGLITGAVVIFRDISDRKAFEKKKQFLEGQLLQAQKLESLGTLAGGVAHDFNNILSIILGHSSLIEMVKDKPEKLQEKVDIITKACERGATIVKQLLTFARKTEIYYVSINLNDIIYEIVKLLKETFPKTIEIRTKLSKTIPYVSGDITQLHQVLLNICVNARDALPEGGIIRIETQRIKKEHLLQRFPLADTDYYVMVSISDNGIGMDDKTKQRVFEPFFTTKGVGKGTGLGLSLVHSIINAHQGFLELETELNRGSTFHFYLPESDEYLTHGTVESSDFTPLKRQANVMFVEDEDMLREFLFEILESQGYSVIMAEDGDKAFKLFESKKDSIDLLISDMGLPKLNGKELIKKVKLIKPELKVILASGFIDPILKNELNDLGIHDFIHKPYSAREVLDKVAKLLNS